MKYFWLIVMMGSIVPVLHATERRDTLVVVEQSGAVEFYDTLSHQRLGSTAVNALPHEITLSPDGKTAYVTNFGLQDYDETIGTPGDTISIIDTQTFQQKAILSTGIHNAPHGIKIRPNHPEELYVNTEIDSKILVFNLQTQKIEKTFTATPGTHNFIFSPDGKTLWLMAAANGVTKMDADTGAVLDNFLADSPIRGIQYTPDGKSIMASSTNQILFFEPDTLSILRTIDNLGVDQILYSALTPDEKYIIAPAVWNNETLIIDNHSGKIIKRLVTGLDPVNVVVDTQSLYAYVSNARNAHVSKINLQTFTMEDIDVQPGPNGLALLPLPLAVGHVSSPMPELTLGTILPLTGEDKGRGRDIMLGYEFFRDTINHQGGLKIGEQAYKLKIVYQDMQSDTQLINSSVEQLSKEHKLDGVLLTEDNNTTPYNTKNYPHYSFIAPLESYQSLGNELFTPYEDEQDLFRAYQEQLNLTMTPLAERAYLSAKLVQKTLVDNLYLPKNQTHTPAVVLLHTSAGVQTADREWAQRLQARGYAVLIVDSFTARGYIDRKSIGWDKAYQAQMEDLSSAYLVLSQQKTVDPTRVGLLGFSLGGYSTLLAMQQNNHPFKLGASFYGHAQKFIPGTAFNTTAIFNGDEDDRSPLSAAQALQKSEPKGQITLFHYPHAKHGFDNPYLAESQTVTDENGISYHLGYNQAAQEKSIDNLFEFLQHL